MQKLLSFIRFNLFLFLIFFILRVGWQKDLAVVYSDLYSLWDGFYSGHIQLSLLFCPLDIHHWPNTLDNYFVSCCADAYWLSLIGSVSAAEGRSVICWLSEVRGVAARLSPIGWFEEHKLSCECSVGKRTKLINLIAGLLPQCMSVSNLCVIHLK